MDINIIKAEVLKYAQNLHIDKLVAGTSGNVSFYDRENKVMVITPSSVNYMEISTENIMVMDLDGNIKEGDGRPSSEWQMHAEVYKNRDDLNAVIHTHSPAATTFAVLQEEIPVILVEMVPYLKGDIMVSDFALPGTPDVGTVALKVLLNRNACLLASHGVLTVGTDLLNAYEAAIYTEDVANIYLKAKSVGTPKLVPQYAAQKMYNKYFGNN